MFLAIINEDIMPSYTVLFAAMALGAIWLARPTAPRVVAVSVLFSLAWLMEWRLMFPTLPAMLVALWVCEPNWQRRLGWIALFLAGMVATAAVVAWAWQGHEGAVGTFDLIWTGKAVRSVWAGFTWAKVGYMWDGMVGYLLGAGVAAIPGIPGWDIWRWVATVWMLAVAFFALPFLWRHWDDPRSRALSAIFGVTFVAGEVFNLYAQPQDPQMQINVMAWLTVGWAVVLVAVRERRRYGRRGLAALAGLTVALFAYNVWSIAPLRGLDSAWEGAIQRMERESDPDRTVWLMHDFDWAMVYGSLHWGDQRPRRRRSSAPRRRSNPSSSGSASPDRCCAIPSGATSGRSPSCAARSIGRSTSATTCWSSGCGTWIPTSSRSRPAWWRAASASRRCAACCARTTSPPRPSSTRSRARSTG